MKNMDRLMRKLERLGRDKAALTRGIQKATIKVQGDAKMLAPVDTGQLRNSIQADTSEVRGQVVGKVHTNIEHAPYIEFGTGQRGDASPSPPKYDGSLSYRQDWTGMPAQPFLFPAAQQNREIAAKMVAAELKTELRQLGRGR